MDASIKDRLTQILGAENLLLDEADLAFYSQDVSKRADFVTQAVMRPGDKEELAAAVKASVEAGYSLFPRGGGMSYTGGYLPTNSKAITIDTARMDRVLEVNTTDMYVTVEAGCRWVDLHEALKGTGVRTPFWGTLSGIRATVGGGMSQNSIFFGSGQHGTAADSVTGFEIVLADGSILKTGAGAQVNATPFQRHFGPDLTGIFTSDAGALGVKATITMRLVREAEHKRFASFDFPDYASMFAAASEVARRGIASESFGFDPYLQSQRMKRQSLASDVKSLTNVMKSSGGALKALKEGAKVALAGRGFMDDVQYSYHFITEAHSSAGADAALAEIEAVCKEGGGKQIENSIPKIISANPFTPLNNAVGPEGERWLPVHGLVPHSRAVDMMDKIEKIFADHSEEMAAHDIHTGYLLATVGASTCVLEPVFFWPDERMEIQEEIVEASAKKNFQDYGSRPDGFTAVMKVRAALVELFREEGAVHLQIGKAYKYREGLEPASFALVETLKKELDPTGQINPGALGLI